MGNRTFIFDTDTRPEAASISTDIVTYIYLALGTFIMFGPVLWLVLVVV